MTFSVLKANEYIQAHQGDVIDTFKPIVHLAPQVGWMNDPNGFVFYKGKYHLFYQFYPYDSQWGPMHWGHAVSEDLVEWEHLPVALAPDQPFDANGCFSGSAIVKEDTLYLMYTGHIVREDGSIRQVQNIAFSKDGVHFEKLATNPVMIGENVPNIQPEDFRDPKLFEKDGRYYAVVAAKHVDQVGCVVLLGSDNLHEWQFESILLKGTPDQGIMFECPDYFELENQSYLVISPMKYPSDDYQYVNLNSTILLKGTVDWTTKTFHYTNISELDGGHDFYAAQSTVDDVNRRIMVGWMHNWGRVVATHQLGHQWACNMTFPRELKQVEGQLKQVFAIDFAKFQSNTVELSDASQTLVDDVDDAIFVEGELGEASEVVFALGHTDDYVSLTVNNATYEVVLDRTHHQFDLGGEEAEKVLVRSVKLHEAIEHVRVLVDRNSIEIEVNHGEVFMTSVHYIALDKKFDVAVKGTARFKF